MTHIFATAVSENSYTPVWVYVLLATIVLFVIGMGVAQELAIFAYRKQVLADYGYRITRQQGLGLVHRPDELVETEDGYSLRSHRGKAEILKAETRLTKVHAKR